MASLYFTDDPLVDARTGDLVQLTGAEARHAFSVARARVGEALSVTDGRGVVGSGQVEAASAAGVSIRLASVRTERVPVPRVWLVQALAKGDRDELAIQAATELGVDGVVPWSAARSVSRWQGPKIDRGLERWTSIVREASKQAIRSRVPEVRSLASTADLAEWAPSVRMFVLEPTASVGVQAAVGRVDLADAPDADIVLVVGPEGGIDPSELDRLTGAGAHLVRLGETILRTSTAGPAALAVVNVALGRWEA